MRSGYIYVQNGKIAQIGQYGYGYSSQPETRSTDAYSLQFGETTPGYGVNTVYGKYRWRGYPLRCLSTVTDW